MHVMVVPAQTPAPHASPDVQASLSLQAEPSGSAAVQPSAASSHDSAQSPSPSGPGQGDCPRAPCSCPRCTGRPRCRRAHRCTRCHPLRACTPMARRCTCGRAPPYTRRCSRRRTRGCRRRTARRARRARRRRRGASSPDRPTPRRRARGHAAEPSRRAPGPHWGVMAVLQCETDDPENVAGAYMCACPMGPTPPVLEPVAPTTFGPTQWRLCSFLAAAARSALVMAG